MLFRGIYFLLLQIILLLAMKMFLFRIKDQILFRYVKKGEINHCLCQQFSALEPQLPLGRESGGGGDGV